MTTTKTTIYMITCDHCNRILSQNDDDGYMTWYYTEKEAKADAAYDGWVVKSRNEAYCNDCAVKLGLKKVEEDDE